MQGNFDFLQRQARHLNLQEIRHWLNQFPRKILKHALV